MAHLHVLVFDVNGNLFHTTRDGFTTGWQPFGNVMAAVGPLPGGGFPQTASCTVDTTNGDLHVCVVDNQHVVWHTIRSANGSWQTWGNASKAAAQDPSNTQGWLTGDHVALAFSAIG